jgi:CHAT domain-containing protein/Tfp pilus assembly protein PilF
MKAMFYVITFLLLFSSDPNTLLQEANSGFEQDLYKEAIPKFEQAIPLLNPETNQKEIADASYKLAVSYFRTARFQDAEELLQKTFTMHEKLGDQESAGFDLTILGYVYVNISKYDEALQTQEKALKIHELIGNKKGIAMSLRGIGLVRYYRAEYDPAVDVLLRGLKIATEINDQENESRLLADLGEVYWLKGDFDPALDHLDRSIQIAEKIKNARLVATATGGRALIYWHQGDLQKALEDFNHCTTLFEQLGTKGSLAVNFFNLGSLQMELGNYREGQELLQKSLEMAVEVKDRGLEGVCLNGLGEIHSDLGEFDLAIDYMKKSVRIAQEIGEKREQAFGLRDIGEMYERNGKYQQALEYYQNAYELSEETGEKRAIGRALSDIGVIYAKLGKHDLAMQQYQKALEIVQSIGNKQNIGKTLMRIGNEQFHKGEMDKAEDSLMKSVEVLREVGDPQSLWPALHELGLVYRDTDRKSEAIKYMKEAVDLVEKVRNEIQLPEQKSGYLEDKLELYEDLLQMLLSNGNISEAFEYAQRSKARAFLDLLAESKINPESGLNLELLDQKRKLVTQLVRIEKSIQKELDNDKPDPAVIRGLENKRNGLDDQYSKLIADIRNSNPRFADLQYPIPLKLAEAQALLNNETVLLEYFVGKNNSHLFEITNKDVHVYQIVGEAQLSKLIQSFREQLQKPDSVLQLTEQSYSHYVKLAADFYLMLMKPAESSFESKTRLVIAPDGVLNYLPFESLLTKTVGSGAIDFSKLPYLATKFELEYVPSASVLSALHKNVQNTVSDQKALLAVAVPTTDAAADPPLPFAKSEVESIAHFYPSNDVTLLIGDQATEENMKRLKLNQYKNLHFASHGSINESRPQLSALVLSSSKGKEDGYLTMREVFDLNLHADLVVLSACKTGLGSQVRGEGVTGLYRAFLCAGTSSVLVSLWNVSDKSAADLMTSFYRNMEKAGMSKSAALKKARMEMISRKGYSHPYYWSAFILIGNP